MHHLKMFIRSRGSHHDVLTSCCGEAGKILRASSMSNSVPLFETSLRKKKSWRLLGLLGIGEFGNSD